MILTIKEITTWLGISVFELWLHIVTLFVFSILLAVKAEHPSSMSWWTVFIPLFICDGCSAYFSSIVFIRLVLAGERKIAALRTLWSSCAIALILVYKVFLCQRLQGTRTIGFSIIHIPLFVLLKLLGVRACQSDLWDFIMDLNHVKKIWFICEQQSSMVEVETLTQIIDDHYVLVSTLNYNQLDTV